MLRIPIYLCLQPSLERPNLSISLYSYRPQRVDSRKTCQTIRVIALARSIADRKIALKCLTLMTFLLSSKDFKVRFKFDYKYSYIIRGIQAYLREFRKEQVIRWERYIETIWETCSCSWSKTGNAVTWDTAFLFYRPSNK